MSPPPELPPPSDLRVRLGRGVLVLENHALLVGGFPSRLVRVRPTGAALIRRWLDGHEIGTDPSAAALARRLLTNGMLVPDPRRAATSGLTVVIPVHGRERSLARCLSALQRTAPEAALLVVDDSSPDPGAVARVADAFGAAVVRHTCVRGPSAARNTGLAHTTAPIVAFVDSDVVVEDGCLARLAGHFADPATGAVAPRVLTEARAPGRIATYEARHSSLDMGPRPGRVSPGATVPYVPSATLVVRRDALASGFDEQLRVGEDVDLVWRLAKAGWNIWYDPEATVRHELRPSIRDLAQRRFSYATSIGALASRHPEALPAIHPDAATFAVTLALLRRPWSATLAAGVHAARLHRTLRGRTHRPSRLVIVLSGRSMVRATRNLAYAIRRPWWPMAAALAVHNRGARQLLVGAWAIGLMESRPTCPSHAALAGVDELIAGAATWWSCLRNRTTVPLRPTRR